MSSLKMRWLWHGTFVVFSSVWFVTLGHSQEASNGMGSNSGSATINCNDTKVLNECWETLPPIKDHGIPSNPQAVENACKVFDSGMECFGNWSKACLKAQDQDRVKASVIGALETYRFLCTDKKFRKEFLQHADCYKRISFHWDECARKFIESLKRVDHTKDILRLCCIRFRYLQCVTDAAKTLCSANATRFLQKLAESLVRSSMRTYHLNQCSNVGDRNCSDPNSAAQSSTKFFSTSPSSIFRGFLDYPTKGIINSMNVLQNLAFSDITTFFCALSREFTPYFSYHGWSATGVEEDAAASLPSSLSSITRSTKNAAALPHSCKEEER